MLTPLTHYRGPWFFLFLSLLLLIAIYPFFDDPQFAYASWFLSFFNSIIILTIVYAAINQGRPLWFLFTLALLTLVFQWLPPSKPILYALYSLRLALYLYAIYFIFSCLLYTSNVGLEEVYGAVSLYLLFGLTWAMLYESIEHIRPHSFYIADVQQVGGALTWPDFIYFSFVTLTTLGYGDITPITSLTRSLAILETISGLFCLGILVAGAITRLASHENNPQMH